MIFKAIRYLIFSRLDLIIEDQRVNNVEVTDPALDKYDYYEVIGIRSRVDFEYDESVIVLSLKPTATAYYEDYLKEPGIKVYSSEHSCEGK